MLHAVITLTAVFGFIAVWTLAMILVADHGGQS
jgi:hypothetical protein